MRDRFFREDENELPYLVNSKRDDYRGGTPSNKQVINDVTYEEFADYVRLLRIPREDVSRIVGYIDVKPANARVSIHRSGDIVSFTFTVKNEYFTQDIHINYNLVMGWFDDHYFDNNCNGLESMIWFKRELSKKQSKVKRKFIGCGGNFKIHQDDYTLEVSDTFNVFAYFEAKDGGTLSFTVDTSKRQIKDDCFHLPYYLYL